MRSRTPKVLHRICGREILGLAAQTALQSGLGPVVAVVPPASESYAQPLDDSISLVTQDRPLGTGHAALQAGDLLSSADTVVILYGDVPLIKSETIRTLVKTHADTEATLTLLTSSHTSPQGMGRIVRSADGSIRAIVEERGADDETLAINEINTGIYCCRGRWLWESLAELTPSDSGEIYLTDLVELAASRGLVIESVAVADGDEALGINTRLELARAESVLRDRIRERWMLNGVSMPDPSTVYIDMDVSIGEDTTVLPNTHIVGGTVIGDACEIGPNSVISDSTVGPECRVTASVIENAVLEASVRVGPFSHIRPSAHLESDVRIGNYGEVKNSRIGKGSRSGHFSYIGDADVGANVNIGAGSITCNYDGENKNRTVIEDGAFIGSDTMLVAPVRIGARARTGVGSVVTKDVPPDASAIGAPARVLTNRHSPTPED